MYETKEVCTHQFPNKVQLLGQDHKWKFAKEDIWQILIRSDFTCEGSFCKDGDLSKCKKEQIKGSWMNYYDQAIMVILDNDLRFIANYKYEYKNVTDPWKMKVNFEKLIPEMNEETQLKFDSRCDQTMIGFVQNRTQNSTMLKHQITCFYSERVQIIDEMRISFAQIAERPRGKSGNLFAAFKPSDEFDQYI